MDTRLEASKPLDGFEVSGNSLTKPEFAIARTPGENHVAEASDLFTVARPSAFVLKPRQTVRTCSNHNDGVLAQPIFFVVPISEVGEVNLELHYTCFQCSAVIGMFSTKCMSQSDKLIRKT